MSEILILLAGRVTFHIGYCPIVHGWPPEGLLNLSDCFVSPWVPHGGMSVVMIENASPERFIWGYYQAPLVVPQFDLGIRRGCLLLDGM